MTSDGVKVFYLERDYHPVGSNRHNGRMFLIRCRGVASLPSITAITPNLLQISAASHVADTHRSPAKLCH